jgi:hypothetical protein
VAKAKRVSRRPPDRRYRSPGAARTATTPTALTGPWRRHACPVGNPSEGGTGDAPLRGLTFAARFWRLSWSLSEVGWFYVRVTAPR